VELLEVRDLVKHFNGVRALKGVSFSLKEGEILGMIGPNGAGKTTLVNIVSGIHKPTSGDVFLKGKRVTGKPSHVMARMGVARTFQHIQIFPEMTVLENVMAGYHIEGSSGMISCLFHLPSVKKEEKKAVLRAMEMLELMGLKSKANWPAFALPYGDQKKVVIARALAGDPQILMLDEPAGGLNETETEEMGDLLERLRGSGITLILIEHDMTLIMDVCHRILVLHHGRKIALGDPQYIQNNPRVIQAYLGGEV
jgi:branched-chain amino acid transport system ATP-binding protein